MSIESLLKESRTRGLQRLARAQETNVLRQSYRGRVIGFGLGSEVICDIGGQAIRCQNYGGALALGQITLVTLPQGGYRGIVKGQSSLTP